MEPRAAALFDTGTGAAAGACIGIEQEYEVWCGAERVDFRDIIHSLPIDGLRLDPGDVNAYRLRSNMALTCDEAEAELASPPITIAPGFAAQVVAYAAAARATLEGLLPEGYTAHGYSTHLSVTVPGPPDRGLAEAYARSYGPGFGALIDRPDSLGIYVRPRPGRLELCGEFVEGARLASVAAYAVGSVLAGRSGVFAPAVAVELLPCRERFGYRVHRTSTGADLYAAGRAASLVLNGGDLTTLQSHLEAAWARVESSLVGIAGAADCSGLGAIVSGAAPLGIEQEGEDNPLSGALPIQTPGPMQLAVERPGLTVRPVLATWDYTVFRVLRGRTERFALVPGDALERFRRALAEEPETTCDRLFAVPAGQLASPEQTSTAGVFSSITQTPTDLLQAEIPVEGATGKLQGKTSSRAGKGSSARIGKLLVPPVVFAPPRPNAAPEPQAAPPRIPPAASGRPWGLIAGAVAAALAAGAVVSAIVATSGDEPPENGAAPTATAITSETTAATSVATGQATPKVTEAAPPQATAGSGTPPPPTAPGAAATATATSTSTSAPQPTDVAGSNTTPSPAAPTAATSTPTSTATARPTETPRPTSTPRPTETPRPTNTPTPSPTPDGGVGPIETPPPRPIPTPTTCVPGGGVICPT